MKKSKRYKRAKKELEELEYKIAKEKARLDRITPNRQILDGCDLNYLSEEEAIRYTELNDYIVRYENKILGSPKERVKIKRALRKTGIKFDNNDSFEKLKSLYKGAKNAQIKI